MVREKVVLARDLIVTVPSSKLKTRRSVSAVNFVHQNNTPWNRHPERTMVEKSALKDNIERKGKNAYYFAHSNTPTGPEWDGREEPRLLRKESQQEGHLVSKHATFEYHKSNITKYSFMDDGSKVKLYIDMENVGEKCSDDDICLDYSEQSFSLVVNNYKEEVQCLSFAKLTAPIKRATYKKKDNKIIITITKAEEGEWHTINDRGPADHDVV